MPAKAKVLFRGTTINFAGGNISKNFNLTCTTTHPAIALLFAMECANDYPDNAVIYIAKMETVGHLKMQPNVLKKIEQEVVLSVSPSEFFHLSEGYIYFRDFQRVLVEMGFEISEIVKTEKLSELCTKVEKITAKEMEMLMEEVKSLIKKI